MSKDKLTDYDSNASNNTDVGGISVAEGMLPSGVNNALRELMSHQKDFADGTEAINALAVDNLKLDGNTISSTDTNGDITIDPDGTGDTIIASGNVGIGAAPESFAKLEVKTSTDKNIAIFDNAAAPTIGAITDAGSSQALRFAGQNIIMTGAGGSGAEHMRIDSSGNVGIGTNAPHSGSKLHILAAGTAQLRLDSGGAATGNGSFIRFMKGGTDIAYIGVAGTILGSTSNDTMFYADGANNMRFATNGVERLRLTSTGHLGINHTNPSFPLVVQGNAANHCSAFYVATNGYAAALFYDSSNTFRGQIQVGSGGTGYLTVSDYRLKTAVNYDWDATSRLKKLKPARFAWIADGDDAVPVDGFLAHEVSHDSDGNPLVLEAISGTKDGMRDEEYEVSAAEVDSDGNVTKEAVMGTRSVPDLQGIDQSKLTPLLTKALIEAVEKIEQLEARITALEAS